MPLQKRALKSIKCSLNFSWEELLQYLRWMMVRVTHCGLLYHLSLEGGHLPAKYLLQWQCSHQGLERSHSGELFFDSGVSLDQQGFACPQTQCTLCEIQSVLSWLEEKSCLLCYQYTFSIHNIGYKAPSTIRRVNLHCNHQSQVHIVNTFNVSKMSVNIELHCSDFFSLIHISFVNLVCFYSYFRAINIRNI